MSSATLLGPVARRFSMLRSGIRALFFVDGTSRFLLTVALFIAATFPLDYFLDLPAYVRLVFLAGGLGLFGYVAWRRWIRPLTVRLSDDDLALFVERHYPEVGDRLISAIQLSRVSIGGEEGPRAYNSPELVRALLEEATEVTSGLDFRRILVGRYVARTFLAALLIAGLFAGLTYVDARWGPEKWGARLAPIYLQRIIGKNVPWPKKIRLKVHPIKEGLARGDDLTVTVSAIKQRAGVSAPDHLVLYYKFDNGDEGELQMERLDREETPSDPAAEGIRYTTRFEKIPGAFTFFVEGGDDRTGKIRVEPQVPPTIDKIFVFYKYPRYLRRADTPEKDPQRTGHVSAPLHTLVRFRARTNVPLVEANMLMEGKGKKETRALEFRNELGEGGQEIAIVSGEFRITQPFGSHYSLRLRARGDLWNRDPLRFTIEGKEDKRPEILILDPLSESEDVTEICARPFVFQVTDDHGIEQVGIEYRVVGARKTGWVRVPVTQGMMGGERGEPQKLGDKGIRVEATLDLKEIRTKDGEGREFPIVPGDQVRVRFRARDFMDIGPRNEAISREIILGVKSIAEIEAALQTEINRIKQVLVTQKKRQESEYDKIGRLDRKFSSLESLTEEQQREIRERKLEQSGIVDRLASVRTDIRRVKRRGLFNRVFNAASAEKLDRAIEELDKLVGDPTRRENYGAALAAVQKLEEAGGAADRQGRSRSLRDAQDFQGRTITGIQRTLDMLEKWASYQEVIRAFREALELQKKVLEGIRGR